MSVRAEFPGSRSTDKRVSVGLIRFQSRVSGLGATYAAAFVTLLLLVDLGFAARALAGGSGGVPGSDTLSGTSSASAAAPTDEVDAVDAAGGDGCTALLTL